jgi:hypothetical protein
VSDGPACAATEESIMSKRQHGNREAKKPKRPPTPIAPGETPVMAMPPAAQPARLKRR